MELQELKDDLAEVKETLQEIKEELARYKGFVGGCFWILGSLFAAMKFVWPWIKDALGVKGG